MLGDQGDDVTGGPKYMTPSSWGQHLIESDQRLLAILSIEFSAMSICFFALIAVIASLATIQAQPGKITSDGLWMVYPPAPYTYSNPSEFSIAWFMLWFLR